MENKFGHKFCRLIGFEFRTSYYDETLEFYQKLGFVIHKEIEDATKKSVLFRNQHEKTFLAIDGDPTPMVEEACASSTSSKVFVPKDLSIGSQMKIFIAFLSSILETEQID